MPKTYYIDEIHDLSLFYAMRRIYIGREVTLEKNFATYDDNKIVKGFAHGTLIFGDGTSKFFDVVKLRKTAFRRAA